jgi:hypothetical protein
MFRLQRFILFTLSSLSLSARADGSETMAAV